MEAFGDLLGFHIRRLKISRNELARRSGVGPGYLTHIINRDVRPSGYECHPSRSVVEKIVESLGLSFSSPESIRLFGSLGYFPPDVPLVLDEQLLKLNLLLNYKTRKDPTTGVTAREILEKLIQFLEVNHEHPNPTP